MDGRALAEDRVELARVHGRDPCRVEVPQAPLEIGRAAERLLDRDLLVEREAHQQRERVLGEEAVGVGIAGERQRGGRARGLGHRGMVAPASLIRCGSA